MMIHEQVRFGGQPVRGFALGSDSTDHTITELQDLIRAKDVEMAAVDAQVTAAKPDPKLVDDWHALQAKYGAARTAALAAITSSARAWWPDSMTTTSATNDAWKQVVSALQPVPMTTTPGDLQDIGNRLIAQGWKPKYSVPQPRQTPGESFMQHTDPTNLENAQPWKWIREHKTALVVGGVALGGVVVLGVLSPYAKLVTAALPRRSAT
jgi:hypothetical protein